jgi:DNA-binding NarL/FixJ family response regulator
MQKAKDNPMINPITEQEKNVALLVAQGKTNSEIAATLFLTPGTIRNYVSSILAKLYLPNRAALAIYVVQHDLITPHQDRSQNIPDPDCYKDIAFMAYA